MKTPRVKVEKQIYYFVMGTEILTDYCIKYSRVDIVKFLGVLIDEIVVGL